MVALVDDIDREQYATEGYVVVPDLFTDDECRTIGDQVAEAAFELALGDADEGPLSYRPMMHLASPELTAWATDPRWEPVVVSLLGPDTRLYWEQCVTKPPQARTELPWHQDSGYTPLSPEEYLTCWLALDDADETNGCLWVQPRSHLGGRRSHHDDGRGGPFRVGHDGPSADGIPVPVRRGSVLAFSSLLMHKSGPNTTRAGRRAWIIQYCTAESRSALSGNVLDDRLLVSEGGRWLEEPVRQREFDLMSVLANYDKG